MNNHNINIPLSIQVVPAAAGNRGIVLRATVGSILTTEIFIPEQMVSQIQTSMGEALKKIPRVQPA